VISPPSPVDVPEDGRRARRHRSRDLAVDALLDLLTEGIVRPTAQQVAERSGVSLRSIFRIFDDVETLHAAAANRQVSRVRHLFVDVAPVGSVTDRVDAIIGINARLYESVAPIRRAALRTAPESAPLREQLGRVRDWLRAEIDRVFATEIGAADGSGRAAGLEVLLSFEAWDQLRTAQELGVAEASDVMRTAVLALLGQQRSR
jgi:TetR/AcrR family transcriptional regulator, regulator of autoinduction and epiphytic fitness